MAAGRAGTASVRFAFITPVAPVPRLEPAFDVTATLGPLEDHGTTRAGHRRVVPITGGLVSGLVSGMSRPPELAPAGALRTRRRGPGRMALPALGGGIGVLGEQSGSA
jgi:hypothetical protein